MTFALIEPDLGRVSGGLRFNAELCAASGGRIERIVAPGNWPEPTDDDVARLRRLVAEHQVGAYEGSGTQNEPGTQDGLGSQNEHRTQNESGTREEPGALDGRGPRGAQHGENYAAAKTQSRPVLIDGLIGSSLDTPLTGPIVVLQHSLAQTFAPESREAQCLHAASAVVTPSSFAAAEVARRYDIIAEVAHPGTQARPVTRPGSLLARSSSAVGTDGSDAPGRSSGPGAAHLICLAAMEDNKNQLFLAHVLQELRGRGVTDWRCTLAGPITDDEYAHDVAAALDGLDSVICVGELDKDAVADLYRHADLLLLPSKAETFGMVVREAAAAAIPSFVTAGTGAQEALGAGRALDLDVAIWADALERWLSEETDRAELSATALEIRESAVHAWEDTARTVLAVLEEVEGHA